VAEDCRYAAVGAITFGPDRFGPDRVGQRWNSQKDFATGRSDHVDMTHGMDSQGSLRRFRQTIPHSLMNGKDKEKADNGLERAIAKSNDGLRVTRQVKTHHSWS
jgi:hypothetical protein